MGTTSTDDNDSYDYNDSDCCKTAKEKKLL